MTIAFHVFVLLLKQKAQKLCPYKDAIGVLPKCQEAVAMENIAVVCNQLMV